MQRTKAKPSSERPSAEEVLARVRAAGLKLTPQRIAIVRELACDPTHPTAQELYERLLPQLPTMSFATVYNTLDALAAAGLCVSRALVPGAARFDANMAPHDHLVCEGCGLVRDVHRPIGPGPPGGGSTPRAGAPVAASSHDVASHDVGGFVVRAVEQIYRGLCATCAAPRPTGNTHA